MDRSLSMVTSLNALSDVTYFLAPKRLISFCFWATEGRSAENRSVNFLAMSNLIG
jgi:hypothetical protein